METALLIAAWALGIMLAIVVIIVATIWYLAYVVHTVNTDRPEQAKAKQQAKRRASWTKMTMRGSSLPPAVVYTTEYRASDGFVYTKVGISKGDGKSRLRDHRSNGHKVTGTWNVDTIHDARRIEQATLLLAREYTGFNASVDARWLQDETPQGGFTEYMTVSTEMVQEKVRYEVGG